MKKFVKGMHKDSGRVDQPPNTYRDALNANLYYTKGAVTNEEGNSVIGGLSMDIVGSITLLNNKVVLFALVENVSRIILVNTKYNSMTSLYINAALNFQKDFPITGEFRVDAKNDTIVYFTDNYQEQIEEDDDTVVGVGDFNPPRAFNITRQLDHVEAGGNNEVLYDSQFNFDVHKLNIFPEVGRHSIISKVDIRSGGALETGAYQLALAYSDENFLETDYFVVSNAVYIFPQFEEALPVDSITGAPAGTPTNKSIVFTVQCFTNNNYTFIQPAIIKTVGGSTTAIKLERTKRLTANGGKIEISYTGLEDATPAAVDDILIDKVKYDTAKSLAQLDNRLYLANLRSRKDIGYQRFANEIKIEPIQLAVEKFDNRVMTIDSLNQGYAAMLQSFGNTIGQTFSRNQSITISTTNSGTRQDANVVDGAVRQAFFQQLRQYLVGNTTFIGDSSTFQLSQNLNGRIAKGHKNYMLNWKHKSYRRGEVYAFYISFVLKNGSETFAYHIPGRAPVCIDFGQRVGGRADLDTNICEDVSISTSAQRWGAIEAGFEGAYPSELSAIYGSNVKVYQFADTSLSEAVQEASGSRMGYWSNENERYPFNLDFKNRTVSANTGVEISVPEGGEDLRGQEVRHHKMPSNLGDFSFVERADEHTDNNGNVFNGYKSQQDLIFTSDGSTTVNQKAPVGKEYKDRNIVNRDKVRILGVKLNNIRIPKSILSQVRGYKVYYAKRKQEDKTILGQSMAVPAQPRYASVDVQSRLIAKQGPYKNGFYLYGGLTHTDDNHMLVRNTAKAFRDSITGTGNQGTYVGDPVFTFHDFQLLRDKPDLTAATHVTCQYATFYRAFQGGPGAYAKPASVTGNSSLFENNDSNLFDHGTEIGTATRVTAFPSLGWVHPDLGNTTNFSSDGEVYDITDQVVDRTEDITNPYGFSSQNAETNKRKRGKQRKIADSDNDVRATELMVRSFKGQVNVASGYVSPGSAMASTSVIKGGSFKGAQFGGGPASFDIDQMKGFWNWSEEELTRENFWMYAIDPGSKKYVRGKINNSVPDSSSFQGASILYNRGGESSIAFGLVSGLPHLKGTRGAISGTGDYSEISGLSETNWNRISKHVVSWGDDNNWCFPDACKIPTTRIPAHIYAEAGAIDNFPNTLNVNTAKNFRGFRYSLEPNDKFQDGLPMSWMVNINAIKTDVFNPFDRQELVWTGFYKEIENPNLATGEVIEDDAAEVRSNYYDGSATSGFVFGGDTFITRYSFRTTSQSYGHTYFRGSTSLNDPGASHSGDFGDLTTSGSGGTKNTNAFHLAEGTRARFQGDIPQKRNPDETFANWGVTNDMYVWFAGNDSTQNLDVVDTSSERLDATRALLNNADNFRQGTVDPVSTIFSFLCESEVNIGLRHGSDKEKGVEVKYFDRDTAREVLFDPPTNDHTDQDNLLYNDDYSLLNEKKVVRPYPKRKPGDENIYEFATRVIRSKATGLFIGDKYREFLANDFKDIPKNRGDIWDVYTQNGQLLIHTERSLFFTRGKEELQINAATAFVGSGNIFTQDPGEAIETSLGYGGTRSILSGVSTPFGRFWVSQRDYKCYLFQGGVKELSIGMESWFRENMPYQIEEYGINLEETNIELDAPTSDVPFGFTSGYDPKYKRILVTKREVIPTDSFLTLYDNNQIQVINVTENYIEENFSKDEEIYIGQQMFVVVDTIGTPVEIIPLGNTVYFQESGWTLSYYPELQAWGSRHSYLPKLYVSTPENFYSFNNTTMWEHSNNAAPGSFYGVTHPFEFEFIDNSSPAVSKAFSTVGYWSDVVKKDGTYVSEYETKTNPGFTSFYVYNSTQVSGIKTNINYLSNARLVDKFWYLNSFRDLSSISTTTNDYINTGAVNVVGQLTQSISTTSETEPMFTSEGVVNTDYVDVDKVWHSRRRFVDHYLGVRLSNDNSSTNLLYLYAAGTKHRQSHR